MTRKSNFSILIWDDLIFIRWVHYYKLVPINESECSSTYTLHFTHLLKCKVYIAYCFIWNNRSYELQWLFINTVRILYWNSSCWLQNRQELILAVNNFCLKERFYIKFSPEYNKYTLHSTWMQIIRILLFYQ